MSLKVAVYIREIVGGVVRYRDVNAKIKIAIPGVFVSDSRFPLYGRCSQAFPVFRALSLPCIILNANRRTKKRGWPGSEANGRVLIMSQGVQASN